MPAVAPLHPWVWPEIVLMSSTTSHKTIEALFARHGLPEQKVSDNGPQFTAEEFEAFVKANGIKHIRSAPYHPSTTRLSLCYRSTPHATTNVSPSELFLQRKIRTRFDLLKPDLKNVVSSKQYHDQHSKFRNFATGQLVMVRDFRSAKKWIPGEIMSQSGPLSYTIKLNDGRIIHRHVDHLQARATHSVELFPNESESTPEDFGSFAEPPTPNSSSNSSLDSQSATSPRYPHRDRHPPERLMNFHI